MALVDQVQDVGWIINSLDDKIAEIRGQIEELKAGAMAEQWATNLEGEVAWLKLELKNAGQQQAGLREQLIESHRRVRSMEGELLDLSRSLEEA